MKSKYDPKKHHRRSIRLKGYDYSRAGLYFITMCCQHRACLFGKIADGKMELNDAGQMVENQWLALKNRFGNIELHEWVVMPNHFHGILEIMDSVNSVAAPVGAPLVGALKSNAPEITNKGQPQGHAPTTTTTTTTNAKTIGDMMDGFKSITTVEYIRGVKNLGWEPFAGKLWQRNYWENIIRNEPSYSRISKYIENNPASWDEDSINPGQGNG